jgi:hypothetical protein
MAPEGSLLPGTGPAGAGPGGAVAGPDGGSGHLRRIGRFQAVLLPLGTLAWLLQSWRAALVFAAGGVASMLFWQLHRWLVTGMLTPALRRRWLFGALVVLKLALLVLLLRGMMDCFPGEALPFTAGLVLFVAAILMEAFWLILRPEAGGAD